MWQLNKFLRRIVYAVNETVVPPPDGEDHLTISGTNIIDYDGVNIFQIRGINFGTYGEDQPGDAAMYAAMGANTVRFVFRWWGEYGGTDVDSRDNAATGTALIDPGHIADLTTILTECKAAGLKVILAFDSNCGQNGAQSPSMETYCTISGSPAQNFWNNFGQRALFINAWVYLMQTIPELIDICEILPEPLEGYDSSWADDVRIFYDEVAAAIKAVAPNALFLVGPRDAYNINLSGEAYDATHNDYIYTGNLLSAALENQETLPNKVKALLDVRDTFNVPVMCQQLGRRSVNDVAGTLPLMNGGLSICTNNNMGYTWWQSRQNTTTLGEFALFAKDGLGGWVEKTTETALIEDYWNQDLALLEAAAISAAAAAGADLFYVKSDLTNVFSDTAGTTPLTAVGQPIARLNSVVGSAIAFTQSTATSRPLLARGANRYTMDFDGTDDALLASAVPFTSGDDMVIIVAGQAADSAAVRIALNMGNANATVRFPYMGFNTTDTGYVSWRGDTGSALEVNSTITAEGRPVVLTAHKVGTAHNLYLDGGLNGTTATGSLGSIASLTRFRIGSTTRATNFWDGGIALVCYAESMTAPQQQAIERFAAYLVGSAYLVSP